MTRLVKKNNNSNNNLEHHKRALTFTSRFPFFFFFGPTTFFNLAYCMVTEVQLYSHFTMTKDEWEMHINIGRIRAVDYQITLLYYYQKISISLQYLKIYSWSSWLLIYLNVYRLHYKFNLFLNQGKLFRRI